MAGGRMNVNDAAAVSEGGQNVARLPHGNTQDQIAEMESEGQATTPGQATSPPPATEVMLTLRRREMVAEQTGAFHFAKPSGFHFRAGQTMDLTLVNPRDTDEEGDTRTFSIASAPDDEDLVIATRLRNTAFKRVLEAMAIGEALKVAGPGGSFTLDRETDRPAVFLAGGIGITPFRSIIRDLTARPLTQPLWLFYSNTTAAAAPFLDELQRLADATPSLHFVPTMTVSASASEWSGETGLIDLEMLGRRLPILGPRYYVAGPPAMVAAMTEMLGHAGVIADNVRSEEFAGY